MIPLAEIKTYLNETSTSYDSFLTEQEQVISQAIEAYCRRTFSDTEYIQRFYEEDYRCGEPTLMLFQFPLTEVTEIKEYDKDGNEVEDILEDVRIHNPTGTLIHKVSGFFQAGCEVAVTYSAGFENIPAPVRSVLLSLIEEKYNKKKGGVEINFGSDVQRISIPGTVSIDFDYSLQSNERSTAFGTILGNYVNTLDYYRSERILAGSGRLEFLD